jgi:hydrogenase maturation protease
MAACTGTETRVRVLGLGNEILADDAIGILAAREIARRFGGAVEVVCSQASGFDLWEELAGASCAVLVDAVQTGAAPPGTLHILTEEQVRAAPAAAPHGIGLIEALAAARHLGLPVPERLIIVGVEAADCVTVGGEMHPDVRAAAVRVADAVGELL